MSRGIKAKLIIAAAGAILTAAVLSACNKSTVTDPGIIDPDPYNEHETAYAQINTVPKTDWTGNWIWDGSDGAAENTWLVFRGKFTVDEKPAKMIADVSVDSRYWLYVNGKNVVYEGGLKRGPDGNSGYYDEVDIAPYLEKGENVIAVQVWYWGKDGSFSYIDSGRGGFLFEACGKDSAGNTVLNVVSDQSWKVARDAAYMNDTGSRQPNSRLPEFNIMYNAQLSIGDWSAPSFNDSDWENATVICRGGEGVWGMLYQRPVPLIKVGSLSSFVNADEAEGITTKSTVYLKMSLPYNAQCVPYLDVECGGGKEIEITTDNTELGSVITRYITAEGRQQFESKGWFNAETVTFKIPEGVKIHALKYRESGYETEFTGSFSSDDSFFDLLWQKALRTLYVTMRDTFMDCPDRERAEWWGDVTNEMAMTMYSMDARSYLLYQKGVFNMISSAENGVLETVVPAGRGVYFELPMQQLAGIAGFRTYYMYTGDKDFVSMVYKPALDYINLWVQGSDGLVVHRPGSWDWMDWGDNADVVGIENAWYYMAMDAVRYFAGIEGDEATVRELTERMDLLYGAYQLLWTEKGFMGSVKRPDDRANALAVLSGLADLNNKEQFDTIRKVLTKIKNASPYMERYVLDALCEMGLMEEAQARIKDRYAGMVSDSCTTLWEYWDKNAGTKNHAWSGGPMLTMSHYAAGVSPLTPGYGSFVVEPQPGSLKYVDCTVPSVRGNIRVEIADGDVFTLKLSSEAYGSTAVVKIPVKSPVTAITFDGEEIFSEGRASASLPSGLSFCGYENGRACFEVAPRDGCASGTFEAYEKESGKDTFTVTAGDTEHGRITVNGSNSVTVNKGDTVEIKAEPEEGYEFAYFTGSIGGRDPEITVTALSDMYIGAVFEKNRSDYCTLEIYVPDDCDMKITVNGKVCRFSSGKSLFVAPNGTEVTAETSDGILHKFLKYSGAAESDEHRAVFRLDGNMKLMVSTNIAYGDNIAKGAKVTCSASYEAAPTWRASNLTDGNLSSGFTTNVLEAVDGILKKPVTINIDLGSVKEFSLISLVPRTDAVSRSGGTPCFPIEFTLKTSKGGSDYTTVGVFATEDDPAGVTQSFEFDAVKARFVRIEITRVGDYASDEAVSDPYRAQIMELMLRNKNGYNENERS